MAFEEEAAVAEENLRRFFVIIGSMKEEEKEEEQIHHVEEPSAINGALERLVLSPVATPGGGKEGASTLLRGNHNYLCPRHQRKCGFSLPVSKTVTKVVTSSQRLQAMLRPALLLRRATHQLQEIRGLI